MSGFDRVRAALRRAGLDRPPAERSRAFERPEDGVAKILAEVDATILARQLTFAFDNGNSVRCIAASRRLVQLLSPGPVGFGDDAVFDCALQPENTATVAELLMTASRGAASLRIAAVPCDAVEGGLSTGAIAGELGIDPFGEPSADAGDPLEALAKAIGPKTLCAFRLLDEDVEILCGEDCEVAQLTEFAGDILDRMLDPDFPLAATLETDGLVVFGLAGEMDRHVVIAGHLGRYLVAVVSGADAAPTLAAWRARHV